MAVEGGHVSAMRTRAKARDYMLCAYLVVSAERHMLWLFRPSSASGWWSAETTR